MLPSLPLLDRDRDDCLRVNSELIHSQWQIWQRPNPGTISATMATPSYVLPPLICVLLDTPKKKSTKTKINKRIYPFFFSFYSDQTKRLIRCCHQFLFFFSFQLLRQKVNSGSESWIEICQLLQVRTETSAEANQFCTVYTIFGHLFLLFFFFSMVTHYKPSITH